jgi:ribosome biogenesis GTPase
MNELDCLGWTPALAASFAALGAGELRPARVVLEHGRFYQVSTGAEELRAVATGRLRHESANAAAMPTVGDWVAVRDNGKELASIRHVLPRHSKFSRRGAGARAAEQVVAANIDTVFLMMGLDRDFNPRRLERYLSVAAGSGATPVVLLNKADMVSPAELAERMTAIAGHGVPVLAISVRAGQGLEALERHLAPGRTGALLGSSGVGKSTLLNVLMGSSLQRTGAVGTQDGRGRHTTSQAQLFSLPGGALIIDTPGLRELQLWEPETSLEGAFAEVQALAAQCRFRDCRHEAEPDCAVLAALAEGKVDAERLASFRKLQGELGRHERRRR